MCIKAACSCCVSVTASAALCSLTTTLLLDRLGRLAQHSAPRLQAPGQKHTHLDWGATDDNTQAGRHPPQGCSQLHVWILHLVALILTRGGRPKRDKRVLPAMCSIILKQALFCTI